MRELLEIRDATGTIVAACEDYVTASFVPRHLDVGTWTVTVPLESASAARLLEPGAGVQLSVDDVPMVSGYVVLVQADTGDGRGLITFTGVDDMVVLTDRLASPQPGTAAPPYNVSAYDTRSGVAETVIKAYADANAGPGAVLARRWPGLTIAPDLARGATVKGTARWPRLLDVAAELATAGGLGLRCVALELDVTQPTDRSATVEFSEARGSLGRLTFEQRAPAATYVYVLGGGEGTARTVLEAAESSAMAAGWWRRERMRDARDTTDLTVMAQRAAEELAGDVDGARLGMTVETIDTPGCQWPDDYGLGDLVRIVTPWGLEVTRQVTQVEIALTADKGTTVTPTLGVLSPETPAALTALTAHARRIARMEAR